MPTGPTWDAFNLLTNQIGELTYIVVAPAAQVAALHQGFEGVAHDPAFERELMAGQGVPYSHIGTAQGQAIFRALAEVSRDVICTMSRRRRTERERSVANELVQAAPRGCFRMPCCRRGCTAVLRMTLSDG